MEEVCLTNVAATILINMKSHYYRMTHANVWYDSWLYATKWRTVEYRCEPLFFMGDLQQQWTQGWYDIYPPLQEYDNKNVFRPASNRQKKFYILASMYGLEPPTRAPFY